jgi:hypothetical protein
MQRICKSTISPNRSLLVAYKGILERDTPGPEWIDESISAIQKEDWILHPE